MDHSDQLNTTPTSSRLPDARCTHAPTCPSTDSPDREAAHVVAGYPEQGWSLLCNGILLSEDTGELLPDGQVIAPHRPTDAPVDGALTFRFADAHVLIGGTSGSGKTSAAAVMHKAAALASTSGAPRLA